LGKGKAQLLTLFKKSPVSVWKEWGEELGIMAVGRNGQQWRKTGGDIGHVTNNARAFTMTLSRVIAK
jgi:hypothetical protein